MKVMYAGLDWSPVEAKPSARAGDGSADLRVQFEARLSRALGAERLVVLTGLGTSRGINTGPDKLPAPTMKHLWDALSKLEGFAEAVELVPAAAKSADVEMLLSRCQFALALGTAGSLAAFVKAAEAEIVRLCRFLDSQTPLPSHEAFLRKVARRSAQLPRTQIFTTNYDLAFETAADRAGFHLIDGFGLGVQRRFDGAAFDLDFVRRRIGERPVLEANVAQFFKLHGSVDWDESSGDIVRNSAATNPVLIYPAEDKFRLSYERPYLECMARLQMALRDPDVALVVLGFGFNDAHIVAPIEAAIRSNVGLQLVVVMPEAELSKNSTVATLRDLAERGDRRITLCAATFDDFEAVLPDLAPRDEREAHRDRLVATERESRS